MADIHYNYPIEKLDQLVSMIYDQGMSPMMSPDLEKEVNLRYQELCRASGDYDDDEDEEFADAVKQHAAAMQKIVEERRKSHSRNIIVLDLTEEEQAELDDGMSLSYIRSDPNSEYNKSLEDITSDEQKLELQRRIQSLGKKYYHQEDFRNAMQIIIDAIEYSLRNDYPWMTYEEAKRQFNEGKIRCNIPIPMLYIDWDTPISDPKILSGIVTGEVHLIDKDQEPVPRKKVKAKPVEMHYDIIGEEDHARMAKIHQAGYNTEISTILKSCSTIYNRYVLPTSFSWGKKKEDDKPLVFDWMQPNAGAIYYETKYGKKTNPVTDIVGLLSEANDRKLNHVIGNSIRDFAASWNYGREDASKTFSSSLEHHDEAVAIETRLMDALRQFNPNV